MIPNIDVSALYSSRKSDEVKLVLESGKFTWMTSDMIQKRRSEGKEITDSLKEIAEIVNNIEFKNLKGEKLGNLLMNLIWLNKKIIKYNQKLNDDTTEKVLSFFSNKFSLKSASISNKIREADNEWNESDPKKICSILRKYQNNPILLKETPKLASSLAKSILQLEKPNEALSLALPLLEYFPDSAKLNLVPHLAPEIRIEFLLKANIDFITKYYANRSFQEDIALSLESLSHKTLFLQQGKLLVQLLQHDRTEKFEKEVHKKPLVGKLLIKYLNTLDVQDRTTTLAYLSPSIRDFYKKQKQEESFKENLIRIQEFVETNKSKMAAGDVGRYSKHRENILKFDANKYSIPYDIEYHQASGDVFVNLGFLDRGGFKIVSKKIILDSNKQLAAGKEKSGRNMANPYSKKEIAILKRMKGKPNVLQIHSAYQYTSTFKGNIQMIITEFCDLGKLTDHIDTLTTKQKLQIAHGIINGVLQTHNEGIIHRDIKPDNIFLKTVVLANGEIEIQAIVGDFGLSCWIDDFEEKTYTAGTIGYVAPEIVNGKSGASFSSDAWSVGKTLAQLFPSRKKPKLIENMIQDLMDPDPSMRMELADALLLLEEEIVPPLNR